MRFCYFESLIIERNNNTNYKTIRSSALFGLFKF